MSTKDVNISINFETIVKTTLFLLLLWVLFVLKNVVLVVLTAIVIASAMEPAVTWFVRHRIPRVFSVLVVYALLVVALALLLYAFFPVLLEEVSGLLATVPSYTETLGSPGSFGALLGDSSVSLYSVVQELRSAFATASGGVLQTVSLVFGGLAGFILVIVFSFYFSVQETGVDDFLRIVTSTKYEQKVISLWKRSQIKIGLWMQGQLLLGVIVGVLVYLGLTILGVPYALLLALLAALFELIPVFGPILSAIPALIIAFTTGGTTLGLLVIGLYLIIQQFENHLIYPLVVTKVVGVPPLLVILALIVGAQLAGFLGVILSVPAAAVIQELVADIEKGRKGVASTPTA